MELSELFNRLSLGELSNLSMSNSGSGEIQEDSKAKLTMYCNEALLRLYTRFILKENDVIVEMVEGTTFYHLLKRFAEQSYNKNDPEIYPYIKDLSREKFEEDVVKILSIYDNTGHKRPLNNDNEWDSLYTPQHNIVQNPSYRDGEVLSIHYQAKHKLLVWDDVEEQTIYLPEVLEGALTNYIAYKVYSHMNTQESVSRAAEYLSTYSNICDEVIERDLVNSSISNSNDKFWARGFR